MQIKVALFALSSLALLATAGRLKVRLDDDDSCPGGKVGCCLGGIDTTGAGLNCTAAAVTDDPDEFCGDDDDITVACCAAGGTGFTACRELEA